MVERLARRYVKHEWSCYGRGAEFELLAAAKCDLCGTEAMVIAIDISDGEYGAVKFCQPCANGLFSPDRSGEAIETTKIGSTEGESRNSSNP